MNIKYIRPETAFVTQEFVKACLHLQMKHMSRDSLTRSLQNKKVCESCKKDFFESVDLMWSRITYQEA